MLPTQIVVLVISVCVYGCVCLTRTKRAALTGDDNPYDLRAALRVLERERRRLGLQAIDPVPKPEMRFEQQPVILDSQDEDPDSLARAVAEKGDSVFYSSDQANDVENLLREIEERKKAENEAAEDDLQTVYGHPLSETDIDMDKFQDVAEKRMAVKKAVSRKRLSKKGLDLTAGKRSAQALRTAFNTLTPDEIHKLLLFDGRLQTKEINKRQRKAKPFVIETRAQSDADLEDAVEAEDAAAIPISQEELKELILGQGEAETPNDIDDMDQMNEIIQAESSAEDPRMDQPIDSEIFKSALQDLAAVQMLQKQEAEKRAEEQEAIARWEPTELAKMAPVLLEEVQVSPKSRNSPVNVDDDRRKKKVPAAEIKPSIQLSTSPSLAEMMAKLWIKHKLEGIEIDYLTDALNAATMTQSSESPAGGQIPIEIDSLQKAIKIEKLMKELGNNDADLEKDGMLDTLALKYLQRQEVRPEDIGISVSKKSTFDDEMQAEVAEARKEREEEAAAAAAIAREQEEEEEEEEEEKEENDYRNNLLRGDEDDRQMRLMYEIPDNKLNQIPSLPRSDYQNVPYQLMDIPGNSEAEDEKVDGEIPLSQDIGLLNSEVSEPGDIEDSVEPTDTEGETELSPEEARRLEAEASIRNILSGLDTEDNLRKQDSNEEEAEETLYYQQEKEKCPILEMSRDCQFADMLSIPLNGRKRDLCNRHEMCYQCGTTIGLGASICDRGFLADSIKECNGNLNCIRLADTFLRLMRVTHKFNALPTTVCNVACVRDYVIGL